DVVSRIHSFINSLGNVSRTFAKSLWACGRVRFGSLSKSIKEAFLHSRVVPFRISLWYILLIWSSAARIVDNIHSVPFLLFVCTFLGNIVHPTYKGVKILSCRSSHLGKKVSCLFYAIFNSVRSISNCLLGVAK